MSERDHVPNVQRERVVLYRRTSAERLRSPPSTAQALMAFRRLNCRSTLSPSCWMTRGEALSESRGCNCSACEVQQRSTGQMRLCVWCAQACCCWHGTNGDKCDTV